MKHIAKSRAHSFSVRRSDVAEEKLAAEVRIADREVASGHYIKHEDMKAWLLLGEPSMNSLRQNVSAAKIIQSSNGEIRDVWPPRAPRWVDVLPIDFSPVTDAQNEHD
jgi:hypothetical protein